MIYDSMSGYEFEEYCYSVLRNVGFYNIQKTKFSGDFGIDIIAEKNGNKIGIQCKRYSSPVGVQAVQEALSGSVYYDCNIAMVLSNQEFTSQAREMARKTNVLLFNIDDLLKIPKNSENPNTLIPTKEDILTLAYYIISAYKNHGIDIETAGAQLQTNEVVYSFKKKSYVRLNTIQSAKNEVAFSLGMNFEIKIDYENQCLLFIFNNKDVAGYEEKIKKEFQKIEEEKQKQKEQERKRWEEAKEKIKNGDFNINDVDEHFYEAGKFAIDRGKISIGMIQRRFYIGFHRAERIIEQLETCGVIGAENGTKPRVVLMSQKEFENMISKL